MKAAELIQKLTQSHVVQDEMAMQMQMGLPYLEKRQSRLCILFKPHKEQFAEGNVEFYAPQYEVAWVYPFEQLIHFSNLKYFGTADAEKPIQIISAERYIGRGRLVLNELYGQCSEVLSIQEKESVVSDLTVKKYQKTYFEAVRDLELTAVYGEEPKC